MKAGDDPCGYELIRNSGALAARSGSLNVTELRQFIEVYGTSEDIVAKMGELVRQNKELDANPLVDSRHDGWMGEHATLYDELKSLYGDALEVERMLDELGWEWDPKKRLLRRRTTKRGQKTYQVNERVEEVFQQIQAERQLPEGGGNTQAVRDEIRNRLCGKFPWGDLDTRPRKRMQRTIDRYLNP
jgi:hypothetical protein